MTSSYSELRTDGGTHQSNRPVTVSARAELLDPVSPGLQAMAEKSAWSLAFVAVLTAAGVYTPLEGYIIDADGTASLFGLAYVLLSGLLAMRGGTLAMAYRRYGLGPHDYKIAKKLAQGRAMTPDEFEQYALERDRERAQQLADEVNDQIRQLGNMEVVDSVGVWGDRVEVTLRDQSEVSKDADE